MRAIRWMMSLTLASSALAAKPPAVPKPWVTPALPGGAAVLTVESDDLLKRPADAITPLKEGVIVAKKAPRVDFAFFPGQTYPGKPWSNWSDGCVLNGRYYSALSDHLSPDGSAYVYEFDPATKKVRLLMDVRKFLLDNKLLAAGEQYTPGKIHSRVMAGKDGWLYFATHRGSGTHTVDKYGYRGDWVFRTWPDPESAKVKSEVVVGQPVPKHCLPASVMDTNRMVIYFGSAAGGDAVEKGVMFAAVDAAGKKVLTLQTNGFDRYAMLSRKTGRVYWATRPEKGGTSAGFKFDPETGKISPCPAVPHVRACTDETADGKIYGVSGNACDIWVFDTATESLSTLGDGAVGSNTYVTSMDVDPTGRFLYYIPAAHSGGPREGTPVIQYDVKNRSRKVIAFMNTLKDKAGAVFEGTFSTALSDDGAILFVTWNLGRPKWDSCGVTAIHIPASERD